MTRTKVLILLASLSASLLISALSGHAQTMKTVTVGGGDVDGTFMIPELGALIFEKDSTLTVEHVMAADQRPQAYRDVDLQTDDVLRMVNGSRVKTADDLTAIFDDLSAGDDIKLGIRRDKSMQIISFAKADPEDLPQVKMMTKTIGEAEGGETESGGIKMIKHSVGEPGAEDDLMVLGGSGLIARQDTSGVVILLALPQAEALLDSVIVEGGDQILKLQGKDINDLDELRTAFDAIEVGETVELVLARDEKQYAVSFEKAEPENLMIKRQ